MHDVTVIIIGTVPTGIPQRVARFLGERMGTRGTVSDFVLDPHIAYEPARGQFDCRRLLPVLEFHAHATHSLVLGMADVDLFSAIFTSVFGEARLGGRAGLFSLYRLRPALYGLPEDSALLEDRTRKEALHELGHLIGLIHCRQPDCVMRFSAAAEEVDLKFDQFCPRCGARARAMVSRGGIGDGHIGSAKD